MISKTITHASSSIHYLCGGKGAELLVCLHGFGESAYSYAFLEKHLGDQYTLLAIDLPLHGYTNWPETQLFTPADLTAIIEKILQQESNPPTFTLMGYSMGGRVSLQLLEQMPQRINRLVLLAPDGLKLNSWYWLATQTSAGNRLFKFAMHKPDFFTWLLKAGHRVKLVNESIYKFVFHFLNDAKQRQQVYAIWTCMRTIKPHLKKVQSNIKATKIPVRMLYGQYDRIILSKRAVKLTRGIKSYCQVALLSCGHQVLHIRNLEAIKAALNL
jgi:pimeloyl-ACP methyl ester carboxylesterase